MHNFCKLFFRILSTVPVIVDINRRSEKIVGVFTFVRQKFIFSIAQECLFLYVVEEYVKLFLWNSGRPKRAGLNFQPEPLSETLTTASRRI